MRVLLIDGEDDFGATCFESNFSVEEIAKRCEKAQGSVIVNVESEGNEFRAELLEFGDVDPAFIRFLKIFIDCEFTKHKNFYVVKEK